VAVGCFAPQKAGKAVKKSENTCRSARLKLPRQWVDYLCLGVGIIALATCLRIEPFVRIGSIAPRRIQLHIAAVSQMMHGEGFIGDVFQDMIGFRRLCEHRDPYPILESAARELGFDLRWPHASTHPPTAFLLVAPIAWMPMPLAEQDWIALSIALIFISLLCYDIRWMAALGLSLCSGIIWGPILSSFQQLTLIWLAGIAIAYRCRFRHAFWAGVGIGIASLTKLIPLGILGYFLFMRKYRAAIGAAVVWVSAIAILLALQPEVFSRYMEMNRQNLWTQITRQDNISVFVRAYDLLGGFGLVAVLAYVCFLVWRNRKAIFFPAQSPDYSFFLYSFLAVMVLPLCWSFSLAPMLPALGYFLLRGRMTHKIISAICLLALAALPTFTQPLLTSAVLLLSSVLFCLEQPGSSAFHVEPGHAGPGSFDSGNRTV
jgi:hypothetical protein